MFTFHQTTGQAYMANPEDERANALLKAYCTGGWTEGLVSIPVAALAAVFVMGLPVIKEVPTVTPLQVTLLYAGVFVACLVALFLSSRAADAIRDALFRRAVSRGRIIVLLDPFQKLVDHMLTQNDLHIYAAHTDATYDDFVALRRIAEDYQCGVVDSLYAAHVVRPALQSVVGRLKAAQLDDQAKRAPLHRASAEL